MMISGPRRRCVEAKGMSSILKRLRGPGSSYPRFKRLAGPQVSCWRSVGSATEGQECNEQQMAFLDGYKTRMSLERLIADYAHRPSKKVGMEQLYQQSRELSETMLLDNARETAEKLLAYSGSRIRKFRDLPYLVVLNPSISETYNMYLKSMSSLIKVPLNPPETLEENKVFVRDVLQRFIEDHADTLPGMSRGFNEVSGSLSLAQIKQFLDDHLKERILMRLIAHQHIELTRVFGNPSEFEPGGYFNGVIKPLNIRDVIKKNAELVNDICLMKYDQTVPVEINTNLYPTTYWSVKDPSHKPMLTDHDFVFPYIEYHLDYILSELFKNSFRAHIENNVADAVQVTVSTSKDPSYLELRIRDKGKGIPPKALKHIFDYSFSTFEPGEDDSYKSLNVPPGHGGNVVAGMGYGLPLLKSYVEIFNDTLLPKNETDVSTTKGLLTVQTYNGWGTDIYLKTAGI